MLRDSLDRAPVPARGPRPHAPGSAEAGRRLGGKPPSRIWRIREDVPGGLRAALITASLVIPFALWVALRTTDAVNPIFLPSPAEVVRAGRDMLTSGQLGGDAWASVRRVAIGFAISLAISVPLGLGMGTFRSVNAFFEPFIAFVRYMPATAFVPLLLIWLGLDESPKIALIVIGTVFFNTLMTANIVWQVPSEMIRVAYTLGAGNLDVFRKVIFPYALPGMIDTARVNLAAAWNLIVVAELVAADEGLGFRIVRAQRFLRTEEIFVVLFVIGFLGIGCDISLRALRNRLAPWSQE